MKKKSINKIWLNYIISILQKYIKKIIIDYSNNYYKIELKHLKFLKTVIKILNLHSLFQFKVLTDIACADFLKSMNRFELNYLVVSLRFQIRLNVSVIVNELVDIQSLISIYSNASWSEREVWDLFGVFFLGHNDLRRILTDYGFQGHPLRKDFPLNGFIEIRYDEDKQYLVYEQVELMQNLRFYDFLNPFHKKYLI